MDQFYSDFTSLENKPFIGESGGLWVYNREIKKYTFSSISLRDLYIKRGAFYNPETGFYELNGLVDITEDEMLSIYNASVTFVFPQNTYLSHALTYLYARQEGIRTYLQPTNPPYLFSAGPIAFNINYICSNNKDIEAFVFDNLPFIELNSAFEKCSKLKTIKTLDGMKSNMTINASYFDCPMLETLLIRRLGMNCSLTLAPNLTRESIRYIIDNSINTSNITLTVSYSVYVKLLPEDFIAATNKKINLAQL